jgi:putative phosphoesterase
MTTSTTEVLLIADTHLRRGAAGVLTSKIEEHLAGADAVLHAGDITDCSVIEALREMAPHADVHAVAGNLDHGLNLPDRLVLDIDGCAVALVHDSGPATGRRRRLRRWFPDSDLVVFGHSHVPWHEVDVRPSDHHRQHHQSRFSDAPAAVSDVHDRARSARRGPGCAGTASAHCLT